MILEQKGCSGFFGLAQMKLQGSLKVEEGGRRGDRVIQCKKDSIHCCNFEGGERRPWAKEYR